MLKEFTCIVCPNGCDVTAEFEGTEIRRIEGAACARGEEYVRQELTAPRRTIASSVAVLGGTLPLASVRTTAAIPKDKIFRVMEEVKKVTLQAPVFSGQVVIRDVLSLGSDIVATKNVPECEK
ncbi:DUF1667 domain-containing protein [Hespellia stercorisuis]|uniref:CxxC motif-containing protein n=1 Tax=Hespellia stercorisuis DSM 15480 TaxID=1121950 RepID=A0A1M6MEU3_9FIRM|nr:DUF1667 domain-containing protein [Hespellia stercorisuis]SHJ81999.1 CxxC motif-containing protein [Hespellia stercorisuis DSM 15480]